MNPRYFDLQGTEKMNKNVILVLCKFIYSILSFKKNHLISLSLPISKKTTVNHNKYNTHFIVKLEIYY